MSLWCLVLSQSVLVMQFSLSVYVKNLCKEPLVILLHLWFFSGNVAIMRVQGGHSQSFWAKGWHYPLIYHHSRCVLSTQVNRVVNPSMKNESLQVWGQTDDAITLYGHHRGIIIRFYYFLRSHIHIYCCYIQ